MTTDHDLLKDITDKHEYHIGEHTQIVLINGCRTCEAYYSLRAVVELLPKNHYETDDKWDAAVKFGFNDALVIMREVIAKELG